MMIECVVILFRNCSHFHHGSHQDKHLETILRGSILPEMDLPIDWTWKIVFIHVKQNKTRNSTRNNI